jgi:hypothetical protein
MAALCSALAEVRTIDVMSKFVYLSFEEDGEAFVAWFARRLSAAGIIVDSTSGRQAQPECAATIVVMTKRGRRSARMHADIQRSAGRPLFSILRRGTRFLTLAGIPYEDCDAYEDGNLERLELRPSFLSDLAEVIAGRAVAAHTPELLPDGIADEIWAVADRAYEADRDYYRDADPELQQTRWQAVIDVATALLGADHPTTLAARYERFAHTAFRRSYDDVADLIADQTRVLGPDHVDTMTTRHMFVHDYHLGWEDEDARMFCDLWNDERRVFGEDHWRTHASMEGYDFTMK